MFANQVAEYALNRPSKCLGSIHGDYRTSSSRFLVGTNDVVGTNELILLRHIEDMNELRVDGSFALPSEDGPIDCLSTCNYDPHIVVTSSSRNNVAKVWKLPSVTFQISHDDDDDDDDDNDDLDDNHLDDNLDGDDYYNNNRNRDDSLYSTSRARTMTDTSTRTNSGEELPHVMDLASPEDPQGSAPISCMLWNPECMPEDVIDDEMFGTEDKYGNKEQSYNTESSFLPETSSLSAPSACTSSDHFLTVNSNNVIATYDMSREGDILHVINGTRDGNKNHYKRRPLYLPKAAWDPHNPTNVAVTDYFSNSLNIVDMRSNEVQSNIHMRRSFCCDVDYNPNKPYMLATGMSDGTVQFWDIRYQHRSILKKLVRGGHSHWATNVKYNPYHDQLIVSGGTDTKLNLWRISSISSAPLLELEGEEDDIHDDPYISDHNDDENSNSSNHFNTFHYQDDDDKKEDESYSSPLASNEINNKINNNNNGIKTKNKNEQDVRVGYYDMNESIYDVTWSASDAWYFCSVTFDGHVTLNHVPSKEKYKILL